jgi:tight adherence protein B
VRTEEALEHFSDRIPIIDVKLFVSAVNISRAVGGNLAETLATLAETLRRRLIMENKVKALTSQGRLQGIVMAMLPVFLIGYLTFMYSSTMQPMFHTWHGWLVIAICVVMEYLGYRMCRKIMTIDI